VKADIGCFMNGRKTPFGTIPLPQLILCNYVGCNVYLQWFEHLAEYDPAPVFNLDIPFVRSDSGEPSADDVRYVVRQLEELVALCERITGSKLDWDKLRRVVELSGKTGELWSKIKALTQRRPSPFDAYFDSVTLMAPLYCLRGTEECLNFFETAYQELLAKADAFYSAGENREAADAYRAALKGMATSSPSYPRTVESLLYALSASRQYEACAGVARGAFEHLRSSPSAANVAGSGLDCALELDKAAPSKKGFVSALAGDAAEVLRGPRKGLAVDDVSGLYETVARERESANDAAGKEKVVREWAAYLEGEAAKAGTAEGRAAFDAHRITAYLELGEPERGIPMLEASERDFPDDYNPPARLALAYRAMKRYDEALAASDRALQRAYGPRKLVILQARADIYDRKGDPASARRTREEALAWAEALPKEQVSERQIAALKKQLETPR